MSKPVLSIDSSLGGCIAAVFDPASGNAFSRTLETGRDQAAKLVPMIEEVMGEAGVEYSALGLIVTTTGPGSFTGLRIGMTTARTFGLALDVPVQGVSTFEAMMKTCAKSGDTDGYLVVLESKRADFYVQSFDVNGAPTMEAACLMGPEIIGMGRNLFLCGDGIARLKEEGDVSVFKELRERNLLGPVILAQTGWQIFAKNGHVERVEPLYMRDADVSVSNKEQRKIANFPV